MRTFLNHHRFPFGFALMGVVLLLLTRATFLDWGLPYPFHPDERNMAVSVMQLSCEQLDDECLNPNFFAYGQLPLYGAYLIAQAILFWSGSFGQDISFEIATVALRSTASAAAVLSGIVMYLLYRDLLRPLLAPSQPRTKHQKQDSPEQEIAFGTLFDRRLLQVSGLLMVVFVPGLIQIARFGTTESLLVLYVVLLTWCAVRLGMKLMRLRWFMLSSACIIGLAVATKLSALSFLAIPALGLLWWFRNGFASDWLMQLFRRKRIKRSLVQKVVIRLGLAAGAGLMIILIGVAISVLFAPYHLIAWEEFLGSMQYESQVAVGGIEVFYTRQFYATVAVIFPITDVFPFVLGIPLYGLFLVGFVLLSWREPRFLLLRLIFLVLFLTQAFFFAKWTRFLAPVFPLMVVIAMLAYAYLYRMVMLRLRERAASHRSKRMTAVVGAALALILISIIPGIAYLGVYSQTDPRFAASIWMDRQMPADSYILSETANVVNLPVMPEGMVSSKYVTYIPFDFYELDRNSQLQANLEDHLAQADYIIVPSRRVFANHTCEWPPIPADSDTPLLGRVDQHITWFDDLTGTDQRCQALRERYPLLNQYYDDLFSGQLGFTEVARFTAYPEIALFGFPLIQFPDEQAEETWSVFDHPVVRIYQRDQ